MSKFCVVRGITEFYYIDADSPEEAKEMVEEGWVFPQDKEKKILELTQLEDE